MWARVELDVARLDKKEHFFEVANELSGKRGKPVAPRRL